MKVAGIKRAILGLVVVGSAAVATMSIAPTARAASASPTIMALNALIRVNNSTTYTYFYVGGQNFTPGGWVTITVANSATGNVLDTVYEQASVAYKMAGTSFSAGWIGTGFHFAAACTVSQVTIQAVDGATGQVSNSVAMLPKSSAC